MPPASRHKTMSKQVKYIFVTGGVLSGLGKGITSASIGNILKERGLRVNMQKFDQYINVDAGTLTLQNVTMVENNAVGGGGAVFNMNTLTLNQVQVFSNWCYAGRPKTNGSQSIENFVSYWYFVIGA